MDTCVPIAIMEAFVPHRRTEPWLGRVGLTVVAAVHALRAGLVFWGNYYEERFMVSPRRLAGIGNRHRRSGRGFVRGQGSAATRLAGSAPAPWIVGLTALPLTSAWWGPAVLGGDRRSWWRPAGMSGGGSARVDLVSNIVIGTVAVVILALAARRTVGDRRQAPESVETNDPIT